MRFVPGQPEPVYQKPDADVFLFRTPGDEFVMRPVLASIMAQKPATVSHIHTREDLANAIRDTQGRVLVFQSSRVMHVANTLLALQVGIAMPRRQGWRVVFAHTRAIPALYGASMPPHGTMARGRIALAQREVWARNELRLTQPIGEGKCLCGPERPVPIFYLGAMYRDLYERIGGFQFSHLTPCAGQAFALRLLAHGVHIQGTPYLGGLYLE